MTIQLKIIKNNIKLAPSLRTSRGTDEAAADNTQFVNSYMKIQVSYIFRVLIMFRFFCILDTANMVKTCDYLLLNNEIILPNLRKCPSYMQDKNSGIHRVKIILEDVFILSFYI